MHTAAQHETLVQLTYPSWLDQDQPVGLPEIDGAHAVAPYKSRRRQAVLTLVVGEMVVSETPLEVPPSTPMPAPPTPTKASARMRGHPISMQVR